MRAAATCCRSSGSSRPDTEATAGDTRVRVIADAPSATGTYRLDLVIAALARRQLWLTDAYFVGTAAYVQALAAAARDGVDVRLLVPGASDIPALTPLSRASYRALLAAGVRVFEWNGTMLHAKTAVADGLWSRVGSTNLNIASWMGNYELDVAIEDRRFGAVMAAQYEIDLTHATEIVLTSQHRVRLAQARAEPRAAPGAIGKRGTRRRGCGERRQRAGRRAHQSPLARRRRIGPAHESEHHCDRIRVGCGALAAGDRVAARGAGCVGRHRLGDQGGRRSPAGTSTRFGAHPDVGGAPARWRGGRVA